jgi:hypothetical protein
MRKYLLPGNMISCKGSHIPIEMCAKCEYFVENRGGVIICGRDLVCPICKFHAIDINSLKAHIRKHRGDKK